METFPKVVQPFVDILQPKMKKMILGFLHKLEFIGTNMLDTIYYASTYIKPVSTIAVFGETCDASLFKRRV